MTLIFGVPLQVLLGQLLLGLVNGSFYAVLSLGLARFTLHRYQVIIPHIPTVDSPYLQKLIERLA